MSINKPYMNIDLLGDVYIVEVISFYEKNLIFIGVNNLNHNFIAMCIELGESERWFFAPITKLRLYDVLIGKIPAYEVFTKCEAQYVWEVSFNNCDYSSGNAVFRRNEDIQDIELPDKDIYFSSFIDDYEKVMKKVQLDLIENVSNVDRRDLIDITFKHNECDNQEIELDLLTTSLDYIQRSLYVIGSDSNYSGSNLNSRVKYMNSLVATETFKGSFGIRLKSSVISDILNESDLQKNIDFLLNLMNSTNDFTKVKNMISGKNSIILPTYYRMMKFFQSNKITMTTEVSSPQKSVKYALVSKEDIDSFVLMYDTSFEPDELLVRYTGELTAIDTVRKKFSFKIDNGISIDGKIDEGLNVEEFRLPHLSEIKVRMIVNESSLIASSTISYLLMEITFL